MKNILKLNKLRICRIVKRLNRFVVEIEIDGKSSNASINNTGRLQGFLTEGKIGYCLKREKPGKTDYRLVAIEDNCAAALIDTNLQMKAFEASVEKGFISWLRGYKLIKRNPKIGKSMLDYLLEDCEGRKIYVEIKSAVLRRGKRALYPDCPSIRGRRHIKELIKLSESGKSSLLVFIAGLPMVDYFAPAIDIDPEIGRLLKEAINKKVTIKAISMYLNPYKKSIVLENPNLPVKL